MKIKPHIRRWFIAGLVFWLPIWIIFLIIRFLFNLMDGTLQLLPHEYQPHQLFGHNVPGFGIVIAVVLIFVTGILVTNFIGHRLVTMWDRFLNRIPLIRSIYSAIQQVLHAFVKPKGEAFRKVLLVEYPRKGSWSIGFQTASQLSELPVKETLTAVFIPTTPNPTSGFLILVPVQDALELNITVEEAFKIIISLGVVMPKNSVSGKPSPLSNPP